MTPRIRARVCALLLFASAIFLSVNAQVTVKQKAERSTCSNIVALTGSVDINCSALTPQQQKTIAQIPAILKMALNNQQYLQTILDKLEELHKPPSDRDVTISVGPTSDATYAFETRFILTNKTGSRITKAHYECAILNENTSTLKLDHPVVLNAYTMSPIEDLPNGLERSLYCDFVADPIANQLNSPLLQIVVYYTVNGHEASVGFRFGAMRKPGDKTYVWLPAGEPQPVLSPQR